MGVAYSSLRGALRSAWTRLLEETLPPHKRKALDESYQAERNPAMRYNMLLEFSSYLRQVRACACPGLLVCALRPWLLTGPHCLRRAPRIMIVEPKEAKA